MGTWGPTRSWTLCASPPARRKSRRPAPCARLTASTPSTRPPGALGSTLACRIGISPAGCNVVRRPARDAPRRLPASRPEGHAIPARPPANTPVRSVSARIRTLSSTPRTSGSASRFRRSAHRWRLSGGARARRPVSSVPTARTPARRVASASSAASAAHGWRADRRRASRAAHVGLVVGAGCVEGVHTAPPSDCQSCAACCSVGMCDTHHSCRIRSRARLRDGSDDVTPMVRIGTQSRAENSKQ